MVPSEPIETCLATETHIKLNGGAVSRILLIVVMLKYIQWPNYSNFQLYKHHPNLDSLCMFFGCTFTDNFILGGIRNGYAIPLIESSYIRCCSALLLQGVPVTVSSYN